jgi:hypothetical protein
MLTQALRQAGAIVAIDSTIEPGWGWEVSSSPVIWL